LRLRAHFTLRHTSSPPLHLAAPFAALRTSPTGAHLPSTPVPCCTPFLVLTVLAMRTARSIALPLLGAALLLGGCSDPDVGQPCVLDVFDSSNNPIDTAVGNVYCSAVPADFFKTGAIECDNLICIRSETGAACPESVAGAPIEVRKYCSKACVSDADCFNKETGLVCRNIVLNEAFISSLPEDVREKYLGQLATSSYCATPATR